MSCKFSCFLSLTDAQRERDIGIFHSDNGDQYKVTYKSNVCRDLLLTIEWTYPKQIFFTVKLYSTSYKRCLCSKGMVINGKKAFMKMRGAFNVSNSRDYKVLCVVSLLPYIRFNDNNEMLPELLNDSGFAESEVEQSSVDENNTVNYEEINARNEILVDDRDTRINAIVNVNEKDLPKEHVNSESVNEMVHASCSNSDLNFGKNAQTDEMMLIDESIATNSTCVASNNTDMSILLINEDSLNSSDTSDKIIKSDNAWKSILKEHNYENRENELEDKLSEIIRHTLNGNSDNYEFKLLDDKSTEENTVIKRNRKKSTLVTKPLTLNDYSQEITENIKTISINNVTESAGKFSESNSSMDTDLPEQTLKIPTATCKEDSSLSYSNKNVREEFSTNISREINHNEGTEFSASTEHEEMGCSSNAVDSDISSDSTKTRLVVESNNASMNKVNSDNKQLVVSKCHYQSTVQNASTSKIQNANPLIVDSNLSQISMSSSSKLKTTEKNDASTSSKNSELQNLSPSKTNFIFHTLVRKLSVSDCDRQLEDAEKNVAGSSGKNLQNLLGSDSDNSIIFPVTESQLKGLSLDMLDLLITAEMADAEITNGEKHIKVHRAIVSARSSGLKKLFAQQRICSAIEMSYIAVVDIPSEILDDVVIFLYVGVIHIKNTKMLHDLHKVAEMYSISDLIDICSKHI